MRHLAPVSPPLDPATAGTAPVPASLDVLPDRDLAQRIATAVFGDGDDDATVTVVDHITVDDGSGPHTTAWIEVTRAHPDGDRYVYRTLNCAHDLVFVPDDRFPDADGNPTVSGRTKWGGRYTCPGRQAAVALRQAQVRAGYQADPALYVPHVPGWSRAGTAAAGEADRDGVITEIVVDLLERERDGEWVGQLHASRMWGSSLYTQTIAGILDVDWDDLRRIVGLAVDAGTVAIDGQVVSLPGRVSPRPTRRWAVYEEEPTCLSLEVLLPASRDEPRVWRVEVRRSGRRHEVVHIGLRHALGDDGQPSDADVDLLERWLATHIIDWRRPYLFHGEVELRRVDDGAYDPSGTPVDAPSRLAATHDALSDDGPAAIEVYLPASRDERHAFRLVARRGGDELAVVERRLGHPIDFGLDGDDVAAIDEAVTALAGEHGLELREPPAG